MESEEEEDSAGSHWLRPARQIVVIVLAVASA